MSLSHRFLKVCRQVHLYLGVFTAPALLFFAITGGLQTFSLHETTRGSSYAPPRWLVVAGQLHKKQTLEVPSHKPRPVANPPVAQPTDAMPAPAAHPTAEASRPKGRNPLPLKIFTALVALSLALSSLTGLYMAWRYSRHAGRVIAVFLAGIAVPILLALI
ncbi:PepSY domain-containing protein [Rhodanobacter sp. DHG33]|uniref:PepSY domain-containing protein n=1 Tax=Rhodanobacter sp. DHG33 TaxID=2775921 RepID=UPI0017862D97|nr:PepSY domain-containing protein [Rhodanobacter sp. DHG33]MBD8899252.1 PepSY domain-containing protein [Rhodanobacter sp. DHG33]